MEDRDGVFGLCGGLKGAAFVVAGGSAIRFVWIFRLLTEVGVWGSRQRHQGKGGSDAKVKDSR